MSTLAQTLGSNGSRDSKGVVELPTAERHHELTASLGMVVFLASWAMMFAALFFSYAILRVRAEVWPPPTLPLLPVGRPALNTIAILVSSGVLHYALYSVRRGNPARTAPALTLAAILGAVFLCLQYAVWQDLWSAGLVPQTGAYASAFYLLTVFHALHVLVGLVALAWLSVRAWRGSVTAARSRSLRMWGIYWHFVAAVWLVMFVTVYLV